MGHLSSLQCTASKTTQLLDLVGHIRPFNIGKALVIWSSQHVQQLGLWVQ